MSQYKPERLAELIAAAQSAISALQTPLTDNTRQIARLREDIKSLLTLVSVCESRLTQAERAIAQLLDARPKS